MFHIPLHKLEMNSNYVKRADTKIIKNKPKKNSRKVPICHFKTLLVNKIRWKSPSSAYVIDAETGKIVPSKRAVTKHILESFGCVHKNCQ